MLTSAAQIEAHNGAARTSYSLISKHLIRYEFRRLIVDKTTAALGERIEAGTQEAKAEEKLVRSKIRKIASLLSRIQGCKNSTQRAAKFINRTAQGADLIAESRKLRKVEEKTK